MIGDVSGTTNANTIEKLQGKTVEARDPKPRQVLTYIDDSDKTGWKGWMPADSNAVIHPPNLPTYTIVAAGVVPVPPGTMPVYNGLVATLRSEDPAGVIHVTFNNYRPIDGTFTYIVKALPVFDKETSDKLGNIMPTVAFNKFEDKGFTLIVFLAAQQPITKDLLPDIKLMIEVSQYMFSK
jgi:hypothetical protein